MRRPRSRPFRARRRAGVHDWLVDTAPDVPRTDLPRPFTGGRLRLRWVRAAVGASLVLVPVLAVALMVNLARAEPAATPTGTADPPSRAAATSAVLRWMQRTPSPLPGGGQLLTWDGATPLPTPSPVAGTPGPPADMETHAFTVLAATGQLFQVSVTTATTPAGGTVTVGDPSLVALPPADPDAQPPGWQTLIPATPTPAVQTAIRAWAAAYTSGDPAALRQSIGDPDAGHAYMPLAGAVFVSLQIGQAGEVWGPNGPRTPGGVPPSMVVRVDAGLYWLAKGQTAAPPDVPAADVSPASFDLLVQRADTASPVVVAWGAAGSGELLTPFGNRIEGRSLQPGTGAPGTATTPAAPPTQHRSDGG
ncbi:hypothetical protein [Microlunatus ginsengisoli]|uniref:Uncharacterized protein n=1 Tax=Microlunatus ginsengisoli TaxID=363863 RepID=A0ABP7ALR5_9ACTN